MSSESNATSGMVSVVMPCYNGADFISETIDSVLAQTYENWELLIIDDGSSDNSLEIVKSYAATDPRIRPISQANAGSAAARNNGIKQARGQYIALLDSDDLWLPEFLESQITFMKSKNASIRSRAQIKRREREKSSVRAKVEHVFAVVKK